MSRKNLKVAELLSRCPAEGGERNYAGYFACFNAGLFFESHDVLEQLWLSDRRGPNDHFYKGLIQFAGAFVHLQKNRLKPAAALFRLSRKYLAEYPSLHERLDVKELASVIDEWIARLEHGNYEDNPLNTRPAPVLRLIPASLSATESSRFVGQN